MKRYNWGNGYDRVGSEIKIKNWILKVTWTVQKEKDMILKVEIPSWLGVQYAPGEERSSFIRNEEAEPNQKQRPVVDVSDGESKVQGCKEQYCIWTWNVKSINQGKLEVIKQEMASVNIDILGISELKWMRTLKFNSDDHYIYCGQESLRRNGIALIVNKESEMQYLDAISKTTEWSLFISR